MKILTNLPFESFEARENYTDVELVTYGPTHRTWVDGQLYPADVAFDPSTGTIEELFAALPPTFYPDLVLIYWPDQDPIPLGLERCPVPVVGVMSDYNLTLPYVTGLWPFFDAWLTDRNGVELFDRLSFRNAQYFCQYSFKAPNHRIYPGESRSIDIGFAGNLNPNVQRDRAPWLDRLQRITERGVMADVRTGTFGEDYGRFLNRCKLGFNRSIRGEMNLRAFEVPACGAVLLMERENREVAEFFEPGEEVLLYDSTNFEDIVCGILSDSRRRERIAQAGHHRVQDYRMSQRLNALLELVTPLRPSRPGSTEFDRALGRGTAMLSSWAPGKPILAQLELAHQLADTDPRPLNAMAATLIARSKQPDTQAAYDLLQRATELRPDHAISARNMEWLLQHGGQPEAARQYGEAFRASSSNATTWETIDGVLLEPCYSATVIEHAAALRGAVLNETPALLGSAVAGVEV